MKILCRFVCCKTSKITSVAQSESKFDSCNTEHIPLEWTMFYGKSVKWDSVYVVGNLLKINTNSSNRNFNRVSFNFTEEMHRIPADLPHWQCSIGNSGHLILDIEKITSFHSMQRKFCSHHIDVRKHFSSIELQSKVVIFTTKNKALLSTNSWLCYIWRVNNRKRSCEMHSKTFYFAINKL